MMVLHTLLNTKIVLKIFLPEVITMEPHTFLNTKIVLKIFLLAVNTMVLLIMKYLKIVLHHQCTLEDLTMDSDMRIV